MATAISLSLFDAISPELATTLVELERQVFESPLSIEAILAELTHRQNITILIAAVAGLPCGYKVGYRHSKEVFYSWIGGVIPAQRRQGIATLLLNKQHTLAKQLGFSYVRTATKNRYRDMLILNIKSGFNVTGVQLKLGEVEQAILLEKKL